MNTAYHDDNRVELLEIDLKNVRLPGFLKIPKDASGVVIFAHGSGSSRLSPRNRFIADYLYRREIGSLLFDLLTEEEEKQDVITATYRFNISFLAERLAEVSDWLINKFNADQVDFPIGFLGASTGAAAAIEAAVRRPDKIKAIVSRGGRPDLATLSLPRITAPTLLIVGGSDTDVLRLNQDALRYIHAPKKLCIVKGATHLFEEPGALEEVARLATHWFERYFEIGLAHMSEAKQKT